MSTSPPSAQGKVLTTSRPTSYSFCGTFPPEIRNQIYSYLLVADYQEILTSYYKPWGALPKTSQRLAILRTSRQIKTEALPILYQNQFHFCIGDPHYKPRRYSDDVMRLIHHVHISVLPDAMPPRLWKTPERSNSFTQDVRRLGPWVSRKRCCITYQMNKRWNTAHAKRAVTGLIYALREVTSFEVLTARVLLLEDSLLRFSGTRQIIAESLERALGPSQFVESDSGHYFEFSEVKNAIRRLDILRGQEDRWDGLGYHDAFMAAF